MSGVMSATSAAFDKDIARAVEQRAVSAVPVDGVDVSHADDESADDGQGELTIGQLGADHHPGQGELTIGHLGTDHHPDASSHRSPAAVPRATVINSAGSD